MEEDLTCPICLRLLYKPSSTVCGHIFCKECIEKSFKLNPQCPICRNHISRPLVLSPSYLINNILQKNYPEELKKREAASISQISKFPDHIPVFCILDEVHVPGESFCFVLITKKDINYFNNLSDDNKQFAICSELNKTKIFWLSQFESLKSLQGVYLVTATTLYRLNPTYFQRLESPQYKINIQEYTDNEYADHSLYLVPLVKLEDINVIVDKTLEDYLLRFTQDCVSKLTDSELNLFYTCKSKTNQTSFYIASLFKIQNEVLLECFLSNNENHRLRLIEMYFREKVPCRLHLRFARPPQFPYLIAFGMIFVYILEVLIKKVF